MFGVGGWGGKFPFACPRLSEKGGKRRGQVGIGDVLQRECVTAANCGVNTVENLQEVNIGLRNPNAHSIESHSSQIYLSLLEVIRQKKIKIYFQLFLGSMDF